MIFRPQLYPIYSVLFGFIAGLGVDTQIDALLFGGITGMGISVFATFLAYLDGKYEGC